MRAKRINPPRKVQNRNKFLGPAGGSNSLAGKGSTRNSSSNRREAVFEEDEYIAEVTVANQPNFNNVQYAVNPGQAATFPWLNVVAQRFEKYEFEKLEFYYKREVSEFATDGQVGKVMMSVDSDASDSAPTTKQQIEDTEPHVDCMPCENMVLAVPPSILRQRTDAHYVRPGAQPSGTDIKTYDVCNLNIATSGILHNVAVGELHVRYRVRLFHPVLEAAVGTSTARSTAFLQSTSPEAAGATGVPATLALATATNNGLAVVNTAGSIVPPAGNYVFSAGLTTSNTSNLCSKFVLDVKKNGTTVFQSTLPTWTPYENTVAVNTNDISATGFISCNGTDAITVVATVTYTGTQTNVGRFLLLSVS